jgi:hypothetical protein
MNKPFQLFSAIWPFYFATPLAIALAIAPISLGTAQAQQTATKEEAHAIGVDAYLYFYPLVTMDITRQQLSNMEPGKGLGGPMNAFVNIPAYPEANMKTVVRPNFDTLYSSGWLDLTKEPVVVSVPDNYDAVHKIQAGFKITPLSQWGKVPEAIQVKTDASIDMKTPPKVQVDTMSADKYFAYAAELLKLQPPHLTDQPIIARLKRIGFEAGKSFDLDKVDPVVKKALEVVPRAAQRLMEWKIPTLARVVNGYNRQP